MEHINMTIIPPFRVSRNIKPEVRIYSKYLSEVIININQKNNIKKCMAYKFSVIDDMNSFYMDLSDVKGDLELEFCFYDLSGKNVSRKCFKYEVIDSSCNSTTLIDGCWISIYHWSEDEARWFNDDLKNLSEEDWAEQIYAMNRSGIKGVVIQNVFECNEYAGKHDMIVENYKGSALYPTKLYKRRLPLSAKDPVEAILSSADEVNMNIFIGVGNFAWFDFSQQSLEWHRKVTQELFELYGHHPSLYGWYVTEEIFGSLYFDWEPVDNEKYMDIVNFFREYKNFVRCLTPTKPIALAPNNINFQKYEKEWKEILVNVDILLPFAFARDPDNLNIDDIDQICRDCGTHFWADMEMFAWPLDNGLVPKAIDELVKEIRIYDKLEQIFGYQFTGIMNHPESKFNLGGEPAKQFYVDYCKYYNQIKNI